MRKCPVCNSDMPDGTAVCPRCGHDTERTVRVRPASGGGSPRPAGPKAPRRNLKVLLVVLAVLFVAADVVLYFHFRNQRLDREEQQRMARIELAERRRADSIAAVELARARRDSIRLADETKKKFYRPADFLTRVSGMRTDDEGIDQGIVDAFIYNTQIERDLRARGYILIDESHRKEGMDVDGEILDYASLSTNVYGINCQWNSQANCPYDTREPWSCVVIDESLCWPTLRFYFDSKSACDEFFSTLSRQNMNRVSDGYVAYIAFEEAGQYFVQYRDCTDKLLMKKISDTSIIIKPKNY